MISVAVAGYAGRMGSAVVDAVTSADDMTVVCGIDPHKKTRSFPTYTSVASALEAHTCDVLVDFTQPTSVFDNCKAALRAGVNCVIGTTGLSDEQLHELEKCAGDKLCVFFAPNFTTGAVLMMQFAQVAAPYFPEVEIIEYHHAKKLDAPSGTALRSAALIAAARDGKPSQAPMKESETAGCEGARGACVQGIPVHSVRSMGYVASQEIIFGSFGQTLTIRHDSWDRNSYMPGVLLGIRKAPLHTGLIVGLENFMDVK